MPMKKIFWLTHLSIVLFGTSVTFAQDLPVKEWQSNAHNKPLIFYLSGDGGFNKFSTTLCDGIYQHGFDVIALNSKSYFWDKKTPEQTAADIEKYLTEKLVGRNNQQLVVIGYSFGADVLPFILARLPLEFHNKISMAVLMAPSESTDFEIHWSDILGGNSKREMDVPSEINKLTNDKIVILSASDGDHFPFEKITLKRYTHQVLPGGHHFDGDTDEIVKVIVTAIE